MIDILWDILWCIGAFLTVIGFLYGMIAWKLSLHKKSKSDDE